MRQRCSQGQLAPSPQVSELRAPVAQCKCPGLPVKQLLACAHPSSGQSSAAPSPR